VPNEPKVHWQIPGLPILFKRSAIPPIHVKLTIRKGKNFSNNVQENMEKAIESCDPHDCIGN
jgi:hypothetical protein